MIIIEYNEFENFAGKYLPPFHDFVLLKIPSKFILAIKTLSVDRFSKILQVLLGQIEI